LSRTSKRAGVFVLGTGGSIAGHSEGNYEFIEMNPSTSFAFFL